MSKSQFVEELTVGVTVKSRFAIVDPQPSNGTTPYKFLLRDRTGTIDAKMWPNKAPVSWAELQRAQYADVDGKVELNNFTKRPEVTVRDFAPVADPGDLDAYLPTCPHDRAKLWQHLTKLVKSLANPTLNQLMTTLFKDPAFKQNYRNAPAAEHMHHPYIGGLMEHSLEVALLCDAVAGMMPELDRDLLVVAALLHDAGKVDELDYGSPRFALTHAGGMLGHVFLGTQRVYSILRQIEGCPEGLPEALCHLLLSHHGKLEWGAPIEPRCPEAYVLHTCDQLSTHRFYFHEARKAAAGSAMFQKAKGLDGRIFTGEFGWERASMSAVVPGEEAIATQSSAPLLRIVEGGEATQVILLPLVGRIAAGTPTDAEQTVDEWYPLPRTRDVREGDFLLRVRGDSMVGAHILDGDILHVRPQITANDGDIVIAQVDGESTVKYLKLKGNRISLRAANPAYSDIYPDGELTIQGKVLGVIRDLGIGTPR